MEMFRLFLVLVGVVLLGVVYMMGRKPKKAAAAHRRAAAPDVYDPSIDELRLPVSDPLLDEQPAQPREPARVPQDTVSNENITDERVKFAEYGDEYSNEYTESALPTLDGSTHKEPSISRDTQIAGDQDAAVTSFASAVKIAKAEEQASVEADIDIDASDLDSHSTSDFDDSFLAEEFSTYNEPVQLDKFEEKLVTIHVMAAADRRFYGSELKRLFDLHGYQYGHMSIYHCQLEDDKVFSIANMVKPGTFDEQEMQNFETPGITLFMRLPIELDSDVAFDFLMREASELAAELGGQLRDSNRNPLSEQTIQHMREDVQQYVFRTRGVLQGS